MFASFVYDCSSSRQSICRMKSFSNERQLSLSFLSMHKFYSRKSLISNHVFVIPLVFLSFIAKEKYGCIMCTRKDGILWTVPSVPTTGACASSIFTRRTLMPGRYVSLAILTSFLFYIRILLDGGSVNSNTVALWRSCKR